MLLLSCSACGGNYFSAASVGSCPDCGAELAPGSTPPPVTDLDGNGRGSNGDAAAEGEFDRLWRLLLGEKPMRADRA
jgi:hypothetical protein